VAHGMDLNPEPSGWRLRSYLGTFLVICLIALYYRQVGGRGQCLGAA